MRRKQRLKELTIKDNFMFGAVMMDEDNCKGLLERVLQIKIDHVEISREKSIVYLIERGPPAEGMYYGMLG